MNRRIRRLYMCLLLFAIARMLYLGIRESGSKGSIPPMKNTESKSSKPPITKSIWSLESIASSWGLPVFGGYRKGKNDVTGTDPLDTLNVQRWLDIISQRTNSSITQRSNSSLASSTYVISSRNAAHHVYASLGNETCPFRPPGLIGIHPPNQTEVTSDELDRKFDFMKPGGWRPSCRPAERLAVIIPYRNRLTHLHVLVNNLIPLLMRQQADFTVFVIEQLPPTVFNRAMLFNIGFLEAAKAGDYDCFVFHDVDMLPANDECLYRCSSHPKQLSSAISSWKYSIPYKQFFGAVVAFSRQQWLDINGASNLYFGWGAEDDDLFIRIVAKKYKPLRYPRRIGVYETFSHKRDSGNAVNPDRMRLLKTAVRRMDQEGLNTTHYSVDKKEELALYTWINVTINMQEVFKTAPSYVLKKIPNTKTISTKIKIKKV